MANVNVKIVLNRKGVSQLLKSPEMLADLERRARSIASAAGTGHEVETSIGRTRARATVRTETFEAMQREATRRSLTSAIDAGR